MDKLDVQQMMSIKEEAPEEQRPGVSQMDLETLNVKEEGEEPSNEIMETCATRISCTAASCQCEEDEDKVLFSQFDQHQATDRDLPTSSCPDQMKAESGGKNCGGAESTRNSDLNANEDDSNPSEPEIGLNEDDLSGKSCCNCQLKPLSDSEPETDDSEEWNESESSESGVKSVTKSCSCPECGKPVLHKGSLQKHVRVTSLSATRSSRCWENEKGVGVEQILDSRRKVQIEQKPSHLSVHTEQKPFMCELCGKRFSERTCLNRHLKIHTGEKPFVCELCGKRYNRNSHLNVHINVHAGQKPFSCEVCGQRFSQRTCLNRHISIHTGEKPFVCELCGKGFRQSSGLYMHRRVHTGEKPYDCKFCGQNFSRKELLMRHISVHTGQKPFVCDVCGKGFSQKGNLNTHMRLHTGLKPFVCDVCGDRFRHKVSLNTHMRVHTGNKTQI
ncbi:zinc finger protein 664-like [Nothobranchius furzeri]|uniref:zinc finger protein 664-like n=1 Tax=Nothobranchius furzeri TaxID=105023 RepID=UPI0039047A73